MKKIIAWESWNVKEKELTDDGVEASTEENDSDEENQLQQMDSFFSPFISDMRPQVIHTPWGAISYDSKLKPSDRWDCWLGYTNFGITDDISNKLTKIEGIEALKIMSRYTFCIGVGKLFQFNNVRKDIENAIYE